MVVTLGFLLMVSLLINAVLMALNDRLILLFPDVTVVLFHILNFLITFGVITLLFAIIFKVLPDAKIKWKEVWVGSMVTAALFILGKFLIGFYLGQSNLGSTYGAAGSIIIILVWVYYSSIILYFGAEFTQYYAKHFGEGVKPNDYAVWVKRQENEAGQQVK
jgi:membrane protein